MLLTGSSKMLPPKELECKFIACIKSKDLKCFYINFKTLDHYPIFISTIEKLYYRTPQTKFIINALKHTNKSNYFLKNHFYD